MRSALERSLTRSSFLSHRIFSGGTSSSNISHQDDRNSRWSSASTKIVGKSQDGAILVRPQSLKTQKASDKSLPVLVSSSNVAEEEPERPGQDDLATATTSTGQALKVTQEDHTLFPERGRDTTNWSKILDIIRDRRRHSRLYEAKMVFRKIVESKAVMPTEGMIATELWDHFIQILRTDSNGLLMVAEYAVRLRQRTGKAHGHLYSRLMAQTHVWRSPTLAITLHGILKADFPPTLADYETLLRLSLRSGRESLAILEEIYKTNPVPFLYSLLVPKLCTQRMFEEAKRWHYLLLKNSDLPRSFHDCKRLLEYHALNKNDKIVADLVKSLAQHQVRFEQDVESFVRNNSIISREIMNRALGQAHGIAPKTLSDDFCARLFATRFFSVDIVISGLQAIGVTMLGSSSLRELVIRDDYKCADVLLHIDKIEQAGILLQLLKFNSMIKEKAALGQSELLRSIVTSDLHPDTFEDMDLQERLLAMYCERNDHLQMQRTFAIIEFTIPKKWRKMQRANLLLRCHISLGNRAKVVSILESIQRNQHPLTPRSSRHFRRAYLTPRRRGVRSYGSWQEVQDLTLLINVMKMTLQSGASIPLEAWREVLRRLGMMGLLARYRNLALWLVDWYTSLPGSSQRFPSRLQKVRFDGLPSSSTQLRAAPMPLVDFDTHKNPASSMSNANVHHADLNILFGRQAQQGMVAWGFQAEVKRRPNLLQPHNARLPCSRTHWQWGLRLLKDLQNRGVLVHQAAVAKACKMRLAQLFNHSVISNKIANRRAKDLNDERSKVMAKYRYSNYVKEMEEIWGRDLFQSRRENADFDRYTYHGVVQGEWKIMQGHERGCSEHNAHSDALHGTS